MANEPEPEEEEKEDEANNFLLLERLFKFIRTKETPLNPVLSGYFAKLVTLLINRKQKNLVPFVFAPNSDIIDNLLYHVYQRSIAELLNKLLNVQDHDFESPIQEEIKAKQHQVLEALIEKIGPDGSEDDHLNASSILQDMLETKDFYVVICQKTNINKLLDFAFVQENANTSSQNAALAVLTAMVQVFHEKKKDEQRNNNQSDEDDTPNLENEESNVDNPLIEVIAHNCRRLSDFLHQHSVVVLESIDTSFGVKIAPLGSLRLKIIELIYQLVRLNKQPILDAIADTEVFETISRLVEAYPWNNFLQLKVQNLYEEVFDSPNVEFRRKVLERSKIVDTIIRLGQDVKFIHQSNRLIRHGYMALITRIANFIIGKGGRDLKDDVKEFQEQMPNREEWKKFVEGELKQTNDNNMRTLGGQQPRNSMDEEDDAKEYEMNMENIMAKFNTFSQKMSNSYSDNQDDEDEEDEQVQVEKHVQEEEVVVQSGIHTIEIEPIKGEEPLIKEFADNTYWKADLYDEDSLNDLMADYQ